MKLLPAGLDRDKLLWGTIAVGTTLTLVFLLIRNFFTGLSSPPIVLYTFALLLPLVGFVIVLFGLYWANRLSSASEAPITIADPETGTTAANAPVGDGLEQTLSSAASRRYQCRDQFRGERIESILREGAIRRIRTQTGSDHETAESLVAAGEWTEDPVAAAFLSEETSYPLSERVRGSFDPGRAYLRRVDRTLTAVEGQIEPNVSSAETAIEGERR
jgi:hypothetical protein